MKLRVNRLIFLVSLLTYEYSFARSTGQSVGHVNRASGSDPRSDLWNSGDESDSRGVGGVGGGGGGRGGGGDGSDEYSVSNGVFDQNTDPVLSLIQKMTSYANGVPVIGSAVVGFLNQLHTIVVYLEKITNGLLGRILGGALPCEISLRDGIECRGIRENGGVTKLVTDMIGDLPRILLPRLLKYVALFSLGGVVNPIVDVVLGGVPE